MPKGGEIIVPAIESSDYVPEMSPEDMVVLQEAADRVRERERTMTPEEHDKRQAFLAELDARVGELSDDPTSEELQGLSRWILTGE